MRGIVVQGKKEAGKYILLYESQIIEKLKMKPFIGTLNLKVEKSFIDDIRQIDGILLDKFVKSGIKYGDVKCLPIKFFDKNAFLLLPEKSNYKDIIEIVAEENLREKYMLKNGDQINIEFLPFIKKSRKYIVYAKPFIGKKEAKITIFYDSIFENGRRELCYLKKTRDSYIKTLPEREVACIIYEKNEREAYEKLVEFANQFQIMSPIRKIKYSKLSEFQVEIKLKKN